MGITSNSEELGFRSAVFQGLSSAGPMLNIFGLFPVIASVATRESFFVVAISAAMGSLAVYTGFSFSKVIRSNGGYYTYVGKILGKDLGVTTALLYVIYGSLAIPSVVLFNVFFIGSAFPVLGSGPVTDLILDIIFSLAVTVMAARGLKGTIKFVSLSSLVEIATIIIFVLYLLVQSKGSFFPVTAYEPTPVIEAVPFGVLAFAGVGSSIFLSENVSNWNRTVSSSVAASFLILILLMAVPAAVISFTLKPQILMSYAENPLSIFSASSFYIQILGLAVILVAINSSMNLAAGYLNAFRQAASKMVRDGILPDNHGIFGRRVWIMFLVLSLIVSVSGTLILGPFDAFILVTGVVSMIFLIVHSLSNSALVKYFTMKGKVIKIIIPVMSITTFVFVVVEESMSGGPFELSGILSISLAILIFALIEINRFSGNRKYSMIGFSAETDPDQ